MQWFLETEAFHGRFHEIALVPIIGLIILGICRFCSSYYTYKQTKNTIRAVLEVFDLGIIYDIWSKPHEYEYLSKNTKLEQLFRGYATIQSFSMCILQTYLLVAYTNTLSLFNKSETNEDGWAYVTLTFFSLIFSYLYIITLYVWKDSLFMDSETNPGVNKPFYLNVCLIFSIGFFAFPFFFVFFFFCNIFRAIFRFFLVWCLLCVIGM